MGEIEILLDEEDRHSTLITQEFDHTSNLLDNVGLDPFSGLIKQQKLRLGD